MTLAPENPVNLQIADGERPGDLAVFYDPLSYAAYEHPYEVYRQLRDQAPVYYNARRDLWVVSRYADVKACLRNHEQMVNALGNDMDGTHDSYGPGNLIALDQPYHTVLRYVVRYMWCVTSRWAPAKKRSMVAWPKPGCPATGRPSSSTAARASRSTRRPRSASSTC